MPDGYRFHVQSISNKTCFIWDRFTKS
uniref:Uncharacterized protein n=1 Tax=Rhizophora mucronata TaxID=61149 RepID=A0A2P2PGW9_RHIMU